MIISNTHLFALSLNVPCSRLSVIYVFLIINSLAFGFISSRLNILLLTQRDIYVFQHKV